MNCSNCGIDIAEHPANRCLDALIAEKVMRWNALGTENPPDAWEDDGDNIHTWEITIFPSFRPSIDNSASMDVLDKFGYWVIKKLGKDFNVYIENNDNVRSGLSEGTDLSLAVCRAAYLAVMEVEG